MQLVELDFKIQQHPRREIWSPTLFHVYLSGHIYDISLDKEKPECYIKVVNIVFIIKKNKDMDDNIKPPTERSQPRPTLSDLLREQHKDVVRPELRTKLDEFDSPYLLDELGILARLF